MKLLPDKQKRYTCGISLQISFQKSIPLQISTCDCLIYQQSTNYEKSRYHHSHYHGFTKKIIKITTRVEKEIMMSDVKTPLTAPITYLLTKSKYKKGELNEKVNKLNQILFVCIDMVKEER